MKIKEALLKGYEVLKKAGIETYRLDTEILLAKVLSVPRWKLFILDKEISRKEEELFLSFLERRRQRIPVAYITKEKEFFGLNLYVEEGVLIPRPETEILVEKVLERIKDKTSKGLEVGIGSGAISVALLTQNKNLSMVATDISEKALKVSEINAKKFKVDDRLFLKKTSILNEISGMFDFIVSNPPYIPESEYNSLQSEVKIEPKEALIAPDEGLFFYRETIKKGKNLLKPNGFFAFEVGYNQAEDVSEILIKEGFKTEIFKDLAGINRVVIGEKSE